MIRFCGCSAALLSFALCGCQKQYPKEKPVYPIQGVVLVDGVPQEGIKITLHDEAGVDPAEPTFPSGFTNANGNPNISTYAAGDGAPAGSYRLTFEWGKVNPLSMSYGGPDRLNGRYSEVAESEIVLKVSADGENDLGVVELTTE